MLKYTLDQETRIYGMTEKKNGLCTESGLFEIINEKDWFRHNLNSVCLILSTWPDIGSRHENRLKKQYYRSLETSLLKPLSFFWF